MKTISNINLEVAKKWRNYTRSEKKERKKKIGQDKKKKQNKKRYKHY